jgi:hypothetical protein
MTRKKGGAEKQGSFSEGKHDDLRARLVDDVSALQFKTADRTWLLMAMISIVLSDQPLIRRNKKWRGLVDQARAALFELHCLLDPNEDKAPDTAQCRSRRRLSQVRAPAARANTTVQDLDPAATRTSNFMKRKPRSTKNSRGKAT